MNAAARVINQSTIFNGQLMDMRISKHLFFILTLVALVLISALAVVYTTNAHRVAFSQSQILEQQANQLQVQWGQLLLEQASLATPARVQQIAMDKLQMNLPSNQQIFLLRAQ